MPRDNDKNNGRPPRRDRSAGGGRGRSGGERGSRDERPARSSAPRGDRKFSDRKFADKKPFGDKRPFSDKKPHRSEGFRKDGANSHSGDRPDRGPRKDFGARDDRSPRSFKPRSRDDAPRGEQRSSRAGFSDRKFGEKRAFTPRGEGGRGDAPRPRFNREDRPQRDERPRFNREDRPQRDERPARRGAPDRGGPRKSFERGEDRGKDKPWQTRDSRDDFRRDSRPPRDGAMRFDRSRDDRGSDERPRFSKPRFDKPRDDRAPRGERPHRTEWQEHPRSERRDERPRRDNEDDSKIFAKRPAFGGRGAYREREPEFDKRSARSGPEKKKSGERIAKLVARAGLCSRRDAEEWITQGRVAVNGRVINSPALDVTQNDVVTIDGKPLPERERTRLFLYHKPRGLMTTHDDPEGRPTVFDNLPEGLPRLISIGRLDFNTEGLLLLTNDGGLARALELPDTGWLRRYRVRAHGEVTQAQLDELKKGVEVDGVKYGSIDATLEHDKGANVWLVFAIREGKNREVRNVMAHLGLEVNRLIRISYGPFQLGDIEEGQVEEVKSRVLRDQLGEKIVASSGAQFDKPVREDADADAPRAKGRVKPVNKKTGLIADRKGRRVLVTRSGGDEARARNEEEASGFGPPRRPTRGYKGKRDISRKTED